MQNGICPNFARWADFIAGSEVEDVDQDRINNELDEVTEYVFEIIQNSNFGQEAHESFLDLAVGTGCLLVEEGDAINLCGSTPCHCRKSFSKMDLMIVSIMSIVNVSCG